jgi:hypothetical protein
VKFSTINSTFVCLLIIFTKASLLFCNSISAAESESTDSQEQTQEEVQPKTKEPMISWPVNLTLLEQQNPHLEAIWSQSEFGQHLSLKYLARAKTLRGTALLLPAQGENSAHPRLIKPLAIQLSQLGFNVVVPNIALADYPVDSYKQNDTASTEENPASNADTNPQVDSQNKPDDNSVPTNTEQATSEATDSLKADALNKQPIARFFASSEAYQSYFTLLLNQFIKELNQPNQNLTLIANQTSAYWLLETQLNANQVQQIVFIDPQIPTNIETDLENAFQKQQQPIYSFLPFNQTHSKFDHAFQQNFWQASNIRIDKTFYDISQIELENTSISRKIAGWVSRLQQSN